MSQYTKIIQLELDAMKISSEVEPRHVEASLNLLYGSLGHLDIQAFRDEIRVVAEIAKQFGKQKLDEMAESFGL